MAPRADRLPTVLFGRGRGDRDRERERESREGGGAGNEYGRADYGRRQEDKSKRQLRVARLLQSTIADVIRRFVRFCV